jgi:hypothetical protein
MIDTELEKVIGKALKLKELNRAKARVRQLERELRGEPARPEEPPYIPEFLVHQPVRPAVRPALSVVDVTPKAAA